MVSPIIINVYIKEIQVSNYKTENKDVIFGCVMTGEINRAIESQAKLTQHLNTELIDIKVACLIQHV